jgi:hypothetical protein
MRSLKNLNDSQSHRYPERPIGFLLLNTYHAPIPANGNRTTVRAEVIRWQRYLYFYPRAFRNSRIGEEV